jgi:hypothetical protein
LNVQDGKAVGKQTVSPHYNTRSERCKGYHARLLPQILHL